MTSDLVPFQGGNEGSDSAATAAQGHAIFTFYLGTEEYGLELAAVKEIVKRRELATTAVPTAPPYILGILSLRGEVVPLIDLKLRLGLGDSSGKELKDSGRIVICEFRESPFGIAVDRVGGVVHVPDDRMEKTPAHIDASQAEYIERIGKYRMSERQRVSEFVPGELSEEKQSAEGVGTIRIVAILHVPKVVDFGFLEEDFDQTV